MAKRHLKLVTPATVNRTVTPKTSPQQQAAHPRVPDRGRGRAADERRHEKPLGSPGRHDDPCGVPAWPARVRVGGFALGPDRVCLGDASRAPGEAGHAQHPPNPRRRTSGATAAQARAGAQVALRVHVGAWRAVSAPPGSRAWSSGPAWRPSSHSRLTRTCSDTRAATRWPTEATTRGRYKPTLATATFSTPSDTLSYRQRGSKISGENNSKAWRSKWPLEVRSSGLTSKRSTFCARSEGPTAFALALANVRRLLEGWTTLDAVVQSALHARAVISYAEPFVHEPWAYQTKELKSVPGFDAEVHDHLLELRNKLIAHSDEEFSEGTLIALFADIDVKLDDGRTFKDHLFSGLNVRTTALDGVHSRDLTERYEGHIQATSNPATPTIRFTKPFKRLVNFLNLRKNIKQPHWHTFGTVGLTIGNTAAARDAMAGSRSA